MIRHESILSDSRTSITEETVEQYIEAGDSRAGLIAKHGLKVRDFVLLSFASDQGPMQFDQLVNVLGPSQTSTLDCIDRLDQSGLIRQQKCPNGSDVVLISATDRGMDFINRVDSADEQ
jgi:DNA-binding MarR family transcriptional regulator